MHLRMQNDTSSTLLYTSHINAYGLHHLPSKFNISGLCLVTIFIILTWYCVSRFFITIFSLYLFYTLNINSQGLWHPLIIMPHILILVVVV
jgi:hypothetical protein